MSRRASGGFQNLSRRRRERAQALASRYPASRQALRFCAAVASFQERIFDRTADREALPWLLPEMRECIEECGTRLLRDAALGLDKASFRKSLDAYWERRDTASLTSLFARMVLQPYAWAADLSPRRQQPEACPRCGHLAQAGVLRPQGQGRALSLICSLCLHEWPFHRGRCPACGEESERRLAGYAAPELPHIQLQACDACRCFLNWIDLAQNSHAIPDVDELAALPLDVWARQRGYRKVQLNLAGI